MTEYDGRSDLLTKQFMVKIKKSSPFRTFWIDSLSHQINGSSKFLCAAHTVS